MDFGKPSSICPLSSEYILQPIKLLGGWRRRWQSEFEPAGGMCVWMEGSLRSVSFAEGSGILAEKAPRESQARNCSLEGCDRSYHGTSRLRVARSHWPVSKRSLRFQSAVTDVTLKCEVVGERGRQWEGRGMLAGKRGLKAFSGPPTVCPDISQRPAEASLRPSTLIRRLCTSAARK